MLIPYRQSIPINGMRRVLILITVCCYCKIGYSQVDSKYLVSTIYLSTQAIATRVNEFFKRDIPRNSKSIPFCVDDKLSFIDIEPFKQAIKDSIVKIDWHGVKALDLRGGFQSQYYFDPVKTDYLGYLMPCNQEKLILNFSKVYGNILVAEITNYRINEYERVKFGRGYRILFLFDKRGTTSQTYEKPFIYN